MPPFIGFLRHVGYFTPGPGTHPASYTMGAGSLPGVKWPRSGVNHALHLPPKLKKEYGYTSTNPQGLHDRL